MKRGNRYKGLAAGCLIAVFLLIGCGRTGEGATEGMAQSGSSGDMQSDAAVESLVEEEQSDPAEEPDKLAEELDKLAEELDKLVMELAYRGVLWEPEDLMQDERVKGFPEELIRQLQEALAAGTSDELLRELADNSLRIEREDFHYKPFEGEGLSEWQEKYQKKIDEMLSDPGETVPFDFYRLDLDGDGMEEILMVEQFEYIFYSNSEVVVLDQDGEGNYTFAGYDTQTYHRLYVPFVYDGNCYIVCNYDDTSHKVTKALGIYDPGEDSGARPSADWRYVCLGRSSTDCEMEELWSDDSDQRLQATAWNYMQQIGLDLMLRNRNYKDFPGEEQLPDREERQQQLAALNDALDDAAWTPEHLGYSAQKQRWIFTLEGRQVYFALYHRNNPEQYLVGAFCYESEETKKLVPVAFYGILPHIEVSIESYWDFEKENREKVIRHSGENADLAFPKDRPEVEMQLWQQVNKGGLDTGTQEEQLVPQGLVDLAKEALFMRDWSVFAGLAEPLELTDHKSVLENWFPNALERWKYMNRIYQYTIGEDTYLLLMEDSGGTARFMINTCYRLTTNGPEYLGDQWNTFSYDYVVSYEGNFYLVDSNYNNATVDTIYIHPLTAEGISQDATKVSLEPAGYVFTKGYQSGSPALEQIERYVEEIQEELMEASSLNENIRAFKGCEEPVTDPVLKQRLPWGYDWYEADIDNDGRLEYLNKYYWYSSFNNIPELLPEQYRLDGITMNLYESWEPECPYDTYGYYSQIQLWYQEFEGKIYTFQLFSTEDYNYYLSVSLVEESQVSWIASYYVTPQCEWRIVTGQNHTGDG